MDTGRERREGEKRGTTGVARERRKVKGRVERREEKGGGGEKRDRDEEKRGKGRERYEEVRENDERLVNMGTISEVLVNSVQMMQ